MKELLKDFKRILKELKYFEENYLKDTDSSSRRK